MNTKKTILIIFLALLHGLPISIDAQPTHRVTHNAEKGKSLLFDGKDDQIRAPYSSTLNIKNGTLEATIKITDSTYLEWHPIITKQLAYQLTLYKYQLSTYDWKNRQTFASGPSLNDKKWHHVALVFQDSVINGSQLYLDGQPIGAAFTYTIFNQTGQVDIGGNNFWDQFFNGLIDEVRIWNKPLSANDIQQYRTTEISRYTDGLVLYYKFNQGIAHGNNTAVQVITDETPNKIDANIFNFSLNDTTSNFSHESILTPYNDNAFVSFIVDYKWLLIYTFSIIALGTIFYRIRVKYLAKQNQKLEATIAARTAQLAKMLNEKDSLIQEVHHRVKNNLQFILSIIDMQMMITKDQNNPTLTDIARRISSIALVHELLYRQDNIEQITSTVYFNAFIEKINQLTDAKDITISLEVEIIELTIKQCTSIGMILSELISNSLKYGFNEQPKPAIQIALTTTTGTKEATLSYADNGQGFDANHYTKGLGSKLISIFCKQINGDFHYHNQSGVLFMLKFTF
jgi:two-component sensor histidine kinase